MRRAQGGALDFTLTLGHAFDEKVITWNGPYDGRGGPLGGSVAPPNPCDNVWEFVK